MTSKQTVAAGFISAAIAVTGVGFGVGGADAQAQAPSQTLKFTSVSLKSHDYARTVYSDTSVDKQNGKVIGYDTTTGRYSVKTEKVTGFVAISLRGGQMFGRFSLDTTDGSLSGTITGGAGVYQGASGKISGKSTNPTETKVVVTYQT